MTVAANITRTVQLFNRSFLDRKDPAESIGLNLLGFSLAHLYSDIDREKLTKVRRELYERVLQKLRACTLEHVQFSVVGYGDDKRRAIEGERDYIVVTRETLRGTRGTILARYLAYGNNLYVSVDSYVLGSLDVGSLLRRVLISFVPLLLLLCPLLCAVPGFLASLMDPFANAGTRSSGISRAMGGLFCCSIPLFGIWFVLWLDVIRGFYQHKDLMLAFRQVFNHVPNDDTFNLDDILMFFKSVLPIITYTIRDVFEENGIEVKTLDEFISNINNVMINTSGGSISMSNSTIGQANRVQSS